jgi:type IV pilus assembly protein PilN
MIRINLLAPERAAAKQKKAPAGERGGGPLPGYLLMLALPLVALLGCGAMWWLQTQTLKDLDSKIASGEKRQKELEAIQKQVDDFQKKKATLENKVLVIEQLRLSQKSPVHMLDEVSKALPDYVWLTSMDETRGALKFQGQSNSLAAVAEFMSGLQRSGWFPGVELGATTEKSGLYDFNVTATFQDPEVAAKQKAAEAAAKAAAPPPPAKRGRK